MEDSNLRPQGCKPCALANCASQPARLRIAPHSIDVLPQFAWESHVHTYAVTGAGFLYRDTRRPEGRPR